MISGREKARVEHRSPQVTGKIVALGRTQIFQLSASGGIWLKSWSSSLGRSVNVVVLEEEVRVGGPRALRSICHGGCHC